MAMTTPHTPVRRDRDSAIITGNQYLVGTDLNTESAGSTALAVNEWQGISQHGHSLQSPGDR